MAPVAWGVKRFAYNAHMNDGEHPTNEHDVPDDGVDLTLIRWMLSLTPAQRLEVLQSNIRSLGALRGVAARR